MQVVGTHYGRDSPAIAVITSQMSCACFEFRALSLISHRYGKPQPLYMGP